MSEQPSKQFPALRINPDLLAPYVPASEPATPPPSPTPTPAPIEQLMDEARIRGDTRMIPEGTPSGDVTDLQVKRVIQNVKDYRQKTSISLGTISKAVGYSNSVISTFLRGQYPGDYAAVAADLDRWLEAQLRRDSSPKVADFVWTGVAMEMMTVAKTAVTARRIGLVYGPDSSGIGKTMALKAIAAEMAASVPITIRKTSASMRGLLDSICEQMRVNPAGSHDDKFKRIADELRDTPRLLIVDQIHNLCGTTRDKPFYVLADLYDATNAPQLWCGTRDIVSYLDRGQARGEEPLAQIRSRIVIARDLLERTLPREHGGRGEPLFTIDEIRKIFAKNRIRLATEASEYLYKLANLSNSGSLRTCVDLVVMTTTIEETKGTKLLTADMLRVVHRGLRNWRAYEHLENKMADDARRPAAKAG